MSRPTQLEEEVVVLFPENYACTLTFGERAENHAGMQLLGEEVKDGFSIEDLKEIQKRFEEKGARCEFVDLNSYLPEDEVKRIGLAKEAAVLVIRNAFAVIANTEYGPDLILNEQFDLPKDTKAFMKGRVVNKLARHNLCFGDVHQSPDFASGKGSIVAYSAVPVLQYLRETLPVWFGEKARKLWCEGNYYYDARKCGIGFHGDSERKRVIALRLGKSIPLHYQWYTRFNPMGRRCVLELNHGDMYVMSEKAVGTDWKKSSILTLRHAAGCEKYTK
jgi:hypothetical protein